MKKLLIAALLMLPLCSLSAKTKKAIYIIVDGIPADVIERINTPNIDEISSLGGYSKMQMGGIIGGYSQTPTISAVCYNALLTGTWSNKNNVWDNSITAPNYNYHTMFRIAKSQKKDVKTAVYSTWLDNRTKLVGVNINENGNFDVDRYFDGLENDKTNYPNEKENLQIFKIDEAVTDKAAQEIREYAPDLTWVYLQYNDDAGHLFGNGEKFDKTVVDADNQVGRIWESVKYRQKNFNEDWMVAVVTDHGRKDDGYGHGGQSARERTVWLATNVKVNSFFSNQARASVDLAPSMCRWMGFEVPKNIKYEWDGVPFIGKESIFNLQAKQQNDGSVKLFWENFNPKENLTVYYTLTNNYKEGKDDEWIIAGKAKAGDNKFIINQDIAKNGFLKIHIEGKNSSANCWWKK
ncbi:MAG: alkaline phosphatase family protein [Bacteroidales bacterium]|nr:alkaline phosphatase family protein [Bacteroidales bacterium]